MICSSSMGKTLSLRKSLAGMIYIDCVSHNAVVDKREDLESGLRR